MDGPLPGSGLLRVAGDDWVGYDTGNSPCPSNHVFDIAFDRQNTAWIATPRGLAAFDGTHWRVYDASNSELRQEYARCVAADPISGSIWVGNQSGLAVFDGTTWTHYDSNNSGLPSNYVEALAIDAAGNVYASTANPGNIGILMRFDGMTWIELLRTQRGAPDILVMDPNGTLWANWPNWGHQPQGGIVRIDGTETTFYNTSNSGLPSDHVTSLTHDGRNLWVGTHNAGLARFDGERWDVFDTTNSGIAQNAVSSIALGADLSVWIGGLGLSIYRQLPPTPVLVEDLRAEPSSGTVRLTWRLPKTRASLIGVEIARARTPGGPYATLTPHILQPVEVMEYEDSEVDPDLDYWYRVALIGLDGTRSFSLPVAVSFGDLRWETMLRVPFQQSRDLVQIHYTIGGPTVPVRLEIFDVAGRLVTTLDQGRRGRGEYMQPWHRLDASGRAVPRSVYVVRLVAGREKLTHKLALVR